MNLIDFSFYCEAVQEQQYTLNCTNKMLSVKQARCTTNESKVMSCSSVRVFLQKGVLSDWKSVLPRIHAYCGVEAVLTASAILLVREVMIHCWLQLQKHYACVLCLVVVVFIFSFLGYFFKWCFFFWF